MDGPIADRERRAGQELNPLKWRNDDTRFLSLTVFRRPPKRTGYVFCKRSHRRPEELAVGSGYTRQKRVDTVGRSGPIRRGCLQGDDLENEKHSVILTECCQAEEFHECTAHGGREKAPEGDERGSRHRKQKRGSLLLSFRKHRDGYQSA